MLKIQFANLFIQGLELEPENSMLWYGVGDSLCYMSKETNQEQLYPIGLSCVKKSFLLDNNNKYSSSMLDRMKTYPNIGEKYIETLEPANLNQIQKFKFDITTERFISEFEQIKNIDGQIKLVMHLGDSKNVNFFEFLKYCIVNNYNPHIRFAALKRISNYKQENLKPFFEELISKNKQEGLEPYFSIALSSLNEDWADKYVNPEFANSNKNTVTYKEKEIVESLKNDEIRAVIALSLIKYDKQEIQKLFNERNQKTLAFYLSYGMNEDGINFLFKNNILDNRGNILEIGWKHIEHFLEVDFNKRINKNESKAQKEIETVKTEISENKKKWWEIWK